MAINIPLCDDNCVLRIGAWGSNYSESVSEKVFAKVALCLWLLSLQREYKDKMMSNKTLLKNRFFLKVQIYAWRIYELGLIHELWCWLTFLHFSHDTKEHSIVTHFRLKRMLCVSLTKQTTDLYTSLTYAGENGNPIIFRELYISDVHLTPHCWTLNKISENPLKSKQGCFRHMNVDNLYSGLLGNLQSIFSHRYILWSHLVHFDPVLGSEVLKVLSWNSPKLASIQRILAAFWLILESWQ